MELNLVTNENTNGSYSDRSYLSTPDTVRESVLSKDSESDETSGCLRSSYRSRNRSMESYLPPPLDLLNIDTSAPLVTVSRVMTKEEEEQFAKEQRDRQNTRTRHGAFYANLNKKRIGLSPDEEIQPAPKSSSGHCDISSSVFFKTKDLPPFEIKTKIANKSQRFMVGFADTMGRRRDMEDDMIINGQFRGRKKEDFFGVFDGHNGPFVANFVAKKLNGVLAKAMEKHSDPKISLQKAFFEINSLIHHRNFEGGCTALVALFVEDKGYVANLGDCRAVVSKNNKAFRLTKDHKPDDADEESRIKELGGWITSKVDKEDIKELEPNEWQFMILACDGLWDVMSDQEAVDISLPVFLNHDCEEVCKRLRDVAYARGSTDNISIMVIRPLVRNSELTAEVSKSRGFHCTLL